ncbi:MAG: hypothetical protein IJY20_06465 [Clostridia bacterium]|nr:hypothetical protein [Clostridia bacterium]
MQQKKNRYVKMNIVDWLLIAVLGLLLLATLVRGIGAAVAQKEETYFADIEIVIRDLDEETANFLSTQRAPFFLQDGTLLATHYTISCQRMTELVRQDDGSLLETESLSAYKATISFRAEGILSKDGTFLLGSTRRLSTGETLLLTQANVSYTADVVRVGVQAG